MCSKYRKEHHVQSRAGAAAGVSTSRTRRQAASAAPSAAGIAFPTATGATAEWRAKYIPQRGWQQVCHQIQAVNPVVLGQKAGSHTEDVAVRKRLQHCVGCHLPCSAWCLHQALDGNPVLRQPINPDVHPAKRPMALAERRHAVVTQRAQHAPSARTHVNATRSQHACFSTRKSCYAGAC